MLFLLRQNQVWLMLERLNSKYIHSIVNGKEGP
jgi:hypothetical protein